uniref:Inner membrane protein n=1 Tax=Angiostrongylus cantonensis TaxID=6313 RepID=A0A0K0DM86_ANGCA
MFVFALIARGGTYFHCFRSDLIHFFAVVLIILVSGQMIVFDSSLESRVNLTQGSQRNEADGVSYAAYFLVGSFCSDGEIHVAHMAPCPLPMTATDSAGDTLSKTIDEEWIADNAEKVTRILPGGINVVG